MINFTPLIHQYMHAYRVYNVSSLTIHIAVKPREFHFYRLNHSFSKVLSILTILVVVVVVVVVVVAAAATAAAAVVVISSTMTLKFNLSGQNFN